MSTEAFLGWIVLFLKIYIAYIIIVPISVFVFCLVVKVWTDKRANTRK